MFREKINGIFNGIFANSAQVSTEFFSEKSRGAKGLALRSTSSEGASQSSPVAGRALEARAVVAARVSRPRASFFSAHEYHFGSLRSRGCGCRAPVPAFFLSGSRTFEKKNFAVTRSIYPIGRRSLAFCGIPRDLSRTFHSYLGQVQSKIPPQWRVCCEKEPRVVSSLRFGHFRRVTSASRSLPVLD